MIVIGDNTYGALSAPQRAVLALKAAWAGKRPDPALLIMPAPQRAEFDRLYRRAALANIRLGKLIRRLRVQADQERLAVAAWELEACHAGVLDEMRWRLDPVGDPKLVRVLEGGIALQCPRSLDDLDETPAGRRAQVLKAVRDRLVGIVNRGYAAEEIFESIQEELGADPYEPGLRELLEATIETADDALWQTRAWLGPVSLADYAAVYAEVEGLVA